MKLIKALGTWDIILMNIAAVIGLRWISLAAAGGSTSIVLWTAALFLFLIPQAFVVTELTKRMPEEGGVYVWSKTVFGDFHGFLAGWCYWTNNLVYFPNLLVYIAGISVFIAGGGYQAVGESKTYVMLFSLALLWIIAFFNIFGLKFGRWVHNVGGLGTCVTGAVLILFGIVAVVRFGIANPMTPENLFSGILSIEKLSFWAAICFAFTGLELAPVLAGEIRNPGKTIPRAIIVSGVVIAGIYIAGTVALLSALPVSDINIISGFLQGISAVGERLGLGWMSNILALLITLGGIGGLMAWFTGAARMPFVAGINRSLPASFSKIHPKYGSPYIAVLVQSGIASLFILMSFIGSTVEEAYLILFDTTLLVYFVPYLYMFAVYIKLRVSSDSEESNHRIPKNSMLASVIGICGFLTTLFAMIMALAPPAETVSILAFELKVAGGFAGFIITGGLIYWLESWIS
jgi:amino acid transporter